MGSGEETSNGNYYPPPEWVFTALESLGLRFAIRQTPQGDRYAGLRIATPSGRWLALTVIASRGTLRVTAHDVRPDPGPDVVAAINRALPLARGYVADPGSLDLVIGIFAGGAVLTVGQLGTLFDHLDQSVTTALGGEGDLGLPALATARADVAIDALQTLDLSATPGCRMETGVHPEGWFRVGATPVPYRVLDSAPALATLNRLQNWTRAGKYVLTEATALRISVLTPLLSEDVTGLIGWSVDQATLMCQVAVRHLDSL